MKRNPKPNPRRTWLNSNHVDVGGKSKVFLSVAVTPEFKDRLEVVAIHRGITMSQLIRDAIEEAVLSLE